MRPNNELKIHIVAVNHGDATILEFPDYDEPPAHFGVVDFGAKLSADRRLITDYMTALLDLRRHDDPNFDYVIDFVCVTHPHNDHYGGLRRFMGAFGSPGGTNKIRRFWDCGFRTNAVTYNQILEDVRQEDAITFTRLAAGAEYEFGDVRITVLAPSIDLRNRFDTHGVGKNDSSVVLKIKYGNSYVILAADAEFASWGKSTEEFPRRERIQFYRDALGLAEREETTDQLKCDLLRASHHGSKHGTSLEYLERVAPNRVVFSSGNLAWYHENKPSWAGKFPHALTTHTIDALEQSLNRQIRVHSTGDDGNLVFKYGGNWTPRDLEQIRATPGTPQFANALQQAWA